ncbi:HlyD family efflux transporter periplasmic adaptor subunit [Carboxylicivirga sp. A043]|uniref:efflux RND transporter periplasmic adaptor subunit n=1 Tax=Carboxylicivirga litoralis TaxID=2816963 RepID=UPI0021CB5999|nr:HlyD family efflux transporter periplasmic adaptor subunit [Carboxylicivirga sp. A043]MCU4155397.1 HlyD family efflux transporter periplasmic adaptor subunit [Carboxylicivirga sp. A043]
MDKRKLSLIIAPIVLLTVIIWQPWKTLSSSHKTIKVEKGLFETTVEATGELKAEKAVDITVPEVSFNDEVDIWAMKILSLIEEGKIVKKGDEVAQLEPTEVEENLTTVNEKLNELYTLVEDAKIDSTLALEAQRETIQKERDRVLDAELKVEQSSFESKAVQRQTAIELEKAHRSLSKSKRDLITKTQKHKTLIARNERKVKRFEYKKNLLEQLRSELIVTSPADGMIIYGNGYNGQKVKVGSRVGRWMPLIATLPDLNTLISEMYVKEIDIAKIKINQDVNITIDAFPKKIFKGRITSIANIGQEIPGEFQNGFKVIVKLMDFEEELLPGMTTTNTIITNSFKDALYIDKKAVLGNDSINYVIQKKGLSLIRKQIITGLETDMYYQVIDGLEENEKVILHRPENSNDLELVELN